MDAYTDSDSNSDSEFETEKSDILSQEKQLQIMEKNEMLETMNIPEASKENNIEELMLDVSKKNNTSKHYIFCENSKK